MVLPLALNLLDIVELGYANYFIKNNTIVNSNNNNLFLKKLKWVEYLEKRFINNEIILIKYIIKKSKMDNVFNKLNNDIQNIIFKYLHPLEIKRIDENKANQFEQDSFEVDKKLREYYLFLSERWFVGPSFWFLFKPYFYNILLDRMKKKMSQTEAKRKLSKLYYRSIRIETFRKYAIECDFDEVEVTRFDSFY